MSDPNHPHDIHKEVRTYLLVFGALIVGTILTVAASWLEVGTAWNITIGLLIAGTKGFLVAGYFMHLMSEKTTVYAILAFTVFFFLGLMFLTIGADSDIPSI